MAHPHMDDIRRSHSDKLKAMVAKAAEHPADRARRIVGGTGGSAQGDAAQPPQEEWTAAPPRQISNLGNVRK